MQEEEVAEWEQMREIKRGVPEEIEWLETQLRTETDPERRERYEADLEHALRIRELIEQVVPV